MVLAHGRFEDWGRWVGRPAGAAARAEVCGKFWETLHIDLRLVNTSDFTIAYCPTNIYSVGTPHEIALCRQQRKPVRFVSPPVTFPALEQLRRRLTGDPVALEAAGPTGGRGAH